MQENSVLTKEDLLRNIQAINKNLEKIISKTAKTPMNGIENLIWDLRAELEMIAIKFKVVLEKEDGKERWQKIYLDNLKGTSSLPKAITLLNETVMNSKDSVALFRKKPVESYKYYWKLKETISSIMPAFVEKKQANSTYFENSDVFEI
ncbi:MAG: hypothetical protein GOP50_00080 [Candidatus Heimdallarchaeota archaeon]|nr:hypothetical protein [Candidatus Heimdallarchaeota archaeon]